MSTPDLRDKLDGIQSHTRLDAVFPENMARHHRNASNKVSQMLVRMSNEKHRNYTFPRSRSSINQSRVCHIAKSRKSN